MPTEENSQTGFKMLPTALHMVRLTKAHPNYSFSVVLICSMHGWIHLGLNFIAPFRSSKKKMKHKQVERYLCYFVNRIR